MKKKDLKTGMVVELNYGKRYMVIVGQLDAYCANDGILINDNEVIELDKYTDDLLVADISNRDDCVNEILQRQIEANDVWAIYGFEGINGFSSIDNLTRKDIIWERINWDAVALRTPVLVRDSKEDFRDAWSKAYYAGNHKVYTPLGTDEWSSTGTAFFEEMILAHEDKKS